MSKHSVCSTHYYRQRKGLPMDNRPLVKPSRKKDGKLKRLLRALLEV